LKVYRQKRKTKAARIKAEENACWRRNNISTKSMARRVLEDANLFMRVDDGSPEMKTLVIEYWVSCHLKRNATSLSHEGSSRCLGACFRSGKYKGKSLPEIILIDLDWFYWMAPEILRQACRGGPKTSPGRHGPSKFRRRIGKMVGRVPVRSR